jgi:hypothetical protein
MKVAIGYFVDTILWSKMLKLRFRCVFLAVLFVCLYPQRYYRRRWTCRDRDSYSRNWRIVVVVVVVVVNYGIRIAPGAETARAPPVAC